MHGSEQMLYQYMEGSSKRFIIPVYQRNYDWQHEHCKQLFDDLVKLNQSGLKSHFFGSIVSSQDESSGMAEYLIIDGQQRLTTVSLLLMAIHNLLLEKKVETAKPRLQDKILEEYLIDKYEPDETKVKLKPIKEDSDAFARLLGCGEDQIKASNITVNYQYFYNRILEEEVSIDDLYEAFCKLQIINIFLGKDDNPQLIFESLNSTGMDLSEGDKIRNYILMGVAPAKQQEKFYNNYWHKIEQFTNYDVSSFIRDYLTIKLPSTPAMKKVYSEFKSFAEKMPFPDKEGLLNDLVNYSRRYQILLYGTNNYNDVKVSTERANKNNPSDSLKACIERLNKFEATVSRPFLMEVLRMAEVKDENASIAEPDLQKIFELTESYIFRRQICDIPPNALNKIFAALNNEIMRLDGSADNYMEKFKYILSRKTGSGIYPSDALFKEALSAKQIYLMRPKNKQYIMERYENWGTKEVKIWPLIEKGTYTIEHIMPQTLQNEWKDALGPDYESIHEEWVHRLANLTLTAYNSMYSNSLFITKKNCANGFVDSGIRMNQIIAHCDKWTLEELKERDKIMVERGLKIWPMVETSYEPKQKALDSISLADDISLKGRKISKYSFKGAEKNIKSWVDMYLAVLNELHSGNPLILLKLAADNSNLGLSGNVFGTSQGTGKTSKLDEGIYIWTNNNTDTKFSLLRKFFSLYEVDEEELFIYLRDSDDVDPNTEDYDPNDRHSIRKAFWIKALPILKNKTGRFKNVNPTLSNWSSTYFGHSGLNVSAIANLTELKVELYIGTKDSELNKRIFEFVHASRSSIEQSAKTSFIWTNEPENRTAKVGIEFKDFGIDNPERWNQSIDFLSAGVNLISDFLLPEVERFYQEYFL